MKSFAVFIFICIISFSSFPQGPGEPFHPISANGATGVGIYGHILFWENPDSTVYNKIYFSDEISKVEILSPDALLKDGYPDSVFSSVHLSLFGMLENLMNYYWRVVEYGQLDSTLGPVWYFKSRMNPSFQVLFSDDFEDTIFTNENWVIVNDGGACVWEQYFPPYPNAYTLPCDPDCNGVLAADSDECGMGTTLLSSAIIGPFQQITWFSTVLEFDQDFNTLSGSDEAWVETSTDFGLTWTEVWSHIGTDLRSTHEFIDISSVVTINEFFIRFKSVQPGWDWWWVVDNVILTYYGPITPAHPPNFIKTEEDTTELKVILDWNNGSCPDPITGYEIFRKDGLPLDTTGYGLLTVVDGNTFSFIDVNVLQNHIYTYKVRTLCGPPGGGSIWGNEATAYIPDRPTSLSTKRIAPTAYSLEQNYPNPFNPTTTIEFEIPGQARNDNMIVTLKVYDVLGNEIATLLNEEKSAGSYEVEFEAGNLTSGIYFYRIKAGNFSDTKKMLLLK